MWTAAVAAASVGTSTFPWPDADPTPSDVLRVSPAMKQWLEDSKLSQLATNERLERLHRALTDPRFGLRRSAFPEPTPTATEAFLERRSNCVGFALLFASLARELEVPVYFVFLPEERRGRAWSDLDLVEDHLVVAVDSGRRLRLFDQDGELKRIPRQARAVPDLKVLSIYYSNRGVEALANGDLALSVERLLRATRLDPWHPAAWVNLGVAQGRTGDGDRAEAAFRRALELAPSSAGAVQNLAALLVNSGREAEAESLARFYALPNPLATLQRAQRHLRSGDLETARRLYSRALALSQ